MSSGELVRRIPACLVIGVTSASLDLSGCSSLPTSGSSNSQSQDAFLAPATNPFCAQLGELTPAVTETLR